MSKPTNTAAVLPAQFARLEVRDAPYPAPGPSQLVIRSAALAINPLEPIFQRIGGLMAPWVKHPTPIGADVAGEVVEVGAGVTRFRVGDRVVGLALGLDEKVNSAAEHAFQQYVVLREHVVAPIPADMAYERAAVVPLALSTAVCGLFCKGWLALPPPTLTPAPTGRVLLVWGASTSVGLNAVQLARAAGVEVVATASPHNHALVRRLGARAVLDYRSPSAVADVVAAMRESRGRTVGAISMGAGSYRKCLAVLSQLEGRKFVAQATVDQPGFPEGRLGMPRFMAGFATRAAGSKVAELRMGVGGKFIDGNAPAWDDEVGPAVWRDYLPEALRSGAFVPAPEPRIVGRGLDKCQEAMDLCLKGVSAKKLVVLM